MSSSGLLPTKMCPRCGIPLVPVEVSPIKQMMKRVQGERKVADQALTCTRCHYTVDQQHSGFIQRILSSVRIH